MKKIIYIMTLVLALIFVSCDNKEYKMINMGEITTLSVDGVSIRFDTDKIDDIYWLIKTKSTGEVKDSQYQKERLEFARNGLNLNLISYSQICVNYENHNETVVLTYERYSSGEIFRTQTIYIPYDKAIKIFSENK